MQIVSFAFVNRYSIPYDNYFYITKVNPSLLSDPLTYSFQLLNTPSYAILETFYDYPVLFFWSSFAVDIIFSLVLFHLLFSLNKNYLVSIIIIFISSPLFLAIFAKFFTEPGIRLIHVFGYGSYILSTRYILGLMSLLSVFFLIKKKYNLSLVFYSLSLMSHPSTSLLLGLFTFLTFLTIRINFKYLINFAIATVVGLAPALIRLWKLENFEITAKLLTKKEWYLRLINDEPDDFSILYILNNNFGELLCTSFVVFVLIYILYKKKNLDPLIKKILYCLLSFPLIFYFLFAILELGSIYFDNFLFIDLVIKSQAGNKILKFCNFPIIFSLAIIFKEDLLQNNLSNKFSFILRMSILLSLMIVPLMINYINPTNYQNKKILLKNLADVKKNNFLDYLNARFFNYKNKTFGHETYFVNIPIEKDKFIKNELNFFKIKKYNDSLKEIPESVDKKSNIYNSVEVYNHLASIIKTYIPEKSSIIILPYFLYLRDVFPNYNFYYLEKNDGNQALGSRLVASIISERLKDLLNVDHKELHSNFSPFLNSDLRRRYLKVDDDKIASLKNKYPNYKYFLTESGHELNQKKIYEDDYYIIYQIN